MKPENLSDDPLQTKKPMIQELAVSGLYGSWSKDGRMKSEKVS